MPALGLSFIPQIFGKNVLDASLVLVALDPKAGTKNKDYHSVLKELIIKLRRLQTSTLIAIFV